MDTLLTTIDERCRGLLKRVAEGGDVAPAMALRLEGMLEAAVLLGHGDEEALDRRMANLFLEELGVTPEDRLGKDWRVALPFPALPLFMERAPVYPSTAD